MPNASRARIYRDAMALVTGARVKIGFSGGAETAGVRAPMSSSPHASPWMPRNALRSSPTTRISKNGMQIHGLDLRHSPSVELFTPHAARAAAASGLHIDNACQTVRRPAAFFAHLLERESTVLSELPAPLHGPLAAHAAVTATLVEHGAGQTQSALLSQRRYLDQDYLQGEELFPAHRYDEDLQQVEPASHQQLAAAHARSGHPGAARSASGQRHCTLHLNARLKPLMVATAGAHKHIVNVSAMEGQFYRTTKTERHPHTNMAKAALNMMTRTSAPDYVRDGIHMNAVDTGWVTDEDPPSTRHARPNWASRRRWTSSTARRASLIPIFAGSRSGTHVWGPVPQGLQICLLVGY